MNKVENLIFKSSNCEKYFNGVGQIRGKVYKLYRHNKYIGTFSSYAELIEHTNIKSKNMYNNSVTRKNILARDGFKVEEVDTEPYKKVERSLDKPPKILVAIKGNDVRLYKSVSEAARDLEISRVVVGNAISGLIEHKNGWVFRWEK